MFALSTDEMNNWILGLRICIDQAHKRFPTDKVCFL